MQSQFSRLSVRSVIAGAVFTAVFGSAAHAFPSTGTCAMLITQPVAYGQTLPATNGLNILATFTFTSATGGTASSNAVRAVYKTSGPEAGGADLAKNVAFTLTNGPIDGSKTATLTSGLVLNLYAVNNDKTVLVQGQNTLAQGVCQF